MTWWSTTTVVAVSFLVGSVVGIPSVGVADQGGHHDGVKTEVRAQLVPCCGNPEPQAHGKADAKTQSRDGVLQQARFQAGVEIPVPSTGLGITDPTTADIRLVLSRDGRDYAQCFLALDTDNEMDANDDDDDGAEFEVKVALKVKNGTPVLKAGKGQCDINLTMANVQPGVPDVHAGDVATVSVFHPSPAPATPFLQGTFVQRH